MSAWKRAQGIPLGAEVALAFGAGAASFALVAVTLAAARSETVAVVVGFVCCAAVVAMARSWGIAYAAPAAMAALLAYDWFEFPPTHPREFPHSGDLMDLLAYLSGAVLVGVLAAHAGRRADVSEVARGELVDEQAALRRVATLVAQGVPPGELFGAVAGEVGRLVGSDLAGMVRYETDDAVTTVATWAALGEHVEVEARSSLDGGDLAVTIARTRRSARLDVDGRSSAGSPIVVEGRLWGALLVHAIGTEALPVDTEARLENFTELTATAISNAEARAEVARLAEEQAALRRVATLVARESTPAEVLAAVAREVGQLLDVDTTNLSRYEADGSIALLADWGDPDAIVPLGSRMTSDGQTISELVLETGRPARIDGSATIGIRSAVGAPIVVDGRVWGVIVAASEQAEPLPVDTEARIGGFTELVATAIANTEARAQAAQLAEEQAALRHVATLVARETTPGEVFAAVAEEVGRLLGVEDTAMFRYEDDGTAIAVADWSRRDAPVPVGARLTLEGENVTALVLRTGRAARIDDLGNATGSLAGRLNEHGIRSAVAGPIVVDGRLWGAMVVASREAAPLSANAEARIGEFTQLAATAISNVQARSDLAASRARIVAAADEERRKVVRDLHDGAQQRLVHTVITLKLADRALRANEAAAPQLVTEALEQAQRATDELRELAHGILPAVLMRGGLRGAVEALATRVPVPVEVGVSVGRLPATVEATAYFVVAEALTNVAKHSHAARVAVTARVEDGMLRIDVRDDGVGGARPDGSGLLGLAHRLSVLDGRLQVESPADGGTVVMAAIPLFGPPAPSPT